MSKILFASALSALIAAGAAAQQLGQIVGTVTDSSGAAVVGATVKAVEAGTRVTISRYNKPIADLVPAQSKRPAPRRFGTGKGKVKILDPNWDKPIETEEELKGFLKGRF